MIVRYYKWKDSNNREKNKLCCRDTIEQFAPMYIGNYYRKAGWKYEKMCDFR